MIGEKPGQGCLQDVFSCTAGAPGKMSKAESGAVVKREGQDPILDRLSWKCALDIKGSGDI